MLYRYTVEQIVWDDFDVMDETRRQQTTKGEAFATFVCEIE